MSQKNRISISQSIAMQAPLGDGIQSDIEDLIAEAKRSTAARDKFKLAASAQAKSQHSDLAAKGKLGANTQVGYVDQISAYADKQRRKAQRKNAAPIQYNAPTPERAAKATDGVTSKTEIPGAGPVPPVKSHHIQSPIDRYGAGWRPELEQAARDIRDIFLLAGSSARITSSYEGMASTVPGARHGGVADHIREAQAIASLIEAKFPMCMNDVSWFVTQIVCNPDGSAMKFEDSGRRILRKHADEKGGEEELVWKTSETLKGVGYGAFYRTLEVLEWFLQEQRALGWGWAKRVENPAAARALSMELRARAQILREQQARKEEAEAKRLKLQKGK